MFVDVVVIIVHVVEIAAVLLLLLLQAAVAAAAAAAAVVVLVVVTEVAAITLKMLLTVSIIFHFSSNFKKHLDYGTQCLPAVVRPTWTGTQVASLGHE